MSYPTITAHNYSNDRSSAESISVGQALAAVRSGECQNMKVIWELDALEERLAERADEESVAEAERDLHAAWTGYVRGL